MVGGAPITQEFADEIGADAYTEDAASADVNGDGVADTADAVLVLQYASEAVSGF